MKKNWFYYILVFYIPVFYILVFIIEITHTTLYFYFLFLHTPLPPKAGGPPAKPGSLPRVFNIYIKTFK